MVDLEATLRSSLDGRYAIEGEVGRGGMSVVFRARDLKHNRTVAIKVLKPDFAGEISEERFHREIEVVASLAHPHILPLHDSGSADGLLYFTMPLVEGESLRAVIEREKEIPWVEAVRVAADIAEALAFAHQHGVIHRDVKPGNIMLTGGHALLTDFGIAHLTEAAGIELTRTGLTPGTPAYMSPEQAGGGASIDRRSDVYSLACVLFEMIAGAPPFEHENARAMLKSHLVGEIPSLEERRPEIPRDVSEAVGRAMSKLPEERFATAEEFAAALKGQRTDSTRERPAKARRLSGARPKWLLTLAAAAAGIILVVAVGPSLWNRVFRPAPAYSVEDPRGSYLIVPSARAGQTATEEALVVDVADWMAFRLGGWESVRVVQEPDTRGPKDDIGLEGAMITRLEEGIRLAQALRVGTLVTVTLRIVGDSAYVEAREYDAADAYEFDRVQSQAHRDELDVRDLLAAPFLFKVLEYRGEETDPGQLLSLSRNPAALQEFQAGRTDLNDWRLEEAEQRFRESMAQDSTFALPHHYLALTLYWQTTRRPELMLEVGGEVARLTARATHLARDSGLPAGHLAPIEAFAAFWAGDYTGARRLYDAILVHDSTNSESWLLRGAVEYEDPWAERGPAGRLAPRSSLNTARRAFETSVSLARDHQLSYGLLFEIDRKVMSAAAGWGCPAFLRPGGPDLPPWRTPEAGDQKAFCPLMADSLSWVPSAEFVASKLPAAKAGASNLYHETLRAIQMWADYAPDQQRPLEERSEWLLWRRSALGCGAEPAEIAELTAQALADKRKELELKGDSTTDDRVRLANLLLATGDFEAAERHLERALELRDADAPGAARNLPAEAANLYLATGRPSRAIEIIGPSTTRMSFAYRDPRDGTMVASGDIQPAFSMLEVLGASGLEGARLVNAFADLDRRWSSPEYSHRDRAVLRRGALAWLGPALLLAPDVQRAWFVDMEEQGIEPPPVWRGLLMSSGESREARRYYEQVANLLAAAANPSSTRLYLVGILAERLGAAEAAEHFARFEACPAGVAAADPRWGLQSLARLHRARTLEKMNRPEEAAEAYRGFAGAFAEAEPALEHLVTEARAVAERLEASGS
jgi:tRNA A-37 threonylcarbamoyl transferase component Bud32/tetratricopeptide (TPR) repeat protein